jgi:hypothetical protein
VKALILGWAIYLPLCWLHGLKFPAAQFSAVIIRIAE